MPALTHLPDSAIHCAPWLWHDKQMFSLIAIAGYCLAWTLEARAAASSHAPRPRGIALLVAVLAVLTHLLALRTHLLLPASIDVNILNLLALLAVLIVLFNWLVSRSNEQHLLELAVYPLAALALVLLEWVPVQPVMLNTLDTPAAVHIVSSLLAYALLSLCALIAIQIAVQDALLRRHRDLGVLRKIPLTGLENLLFRLMLIGVILLSVSLLSGIWYIQDWSAQHLVHKTVLSFLAWLLFSMLLFGRWQLGWRGLVAVRLTLIGMALLLLAYFGSKWVLEIVFDRSWSA